MVAVALPAALKVAKGILTTPSEKRAANVIGGVVESANGGNLVAVAVLDARKDIGIAKERAVWAGGFGKVSAAVLASYSPRRNALIAAIPASAQASPEAAAAYAVSNFARATGTEKAAGIVKQVTDNAGALLDMSGGGGIGGGGDSSKLGLYLGLGAVGLAVAVLALKS